MNKYELDFLKRILIDVTNCEGNGTFEISKEENLIIVQNENYHITKYSLNLNDKNFSKISVYTNEWKDVTLNSPIVSIPIDFENPTSIIKFQFNDGLVDDFGIKVSYKESDKDLWDAKYNAKVKEDRLTKINVELGNEGGLHTVAFMPCCDEYDYTIIKWYAISKISHPSPTNRCHIGGSYTSNSQIFNNIFLEETQVKGKFYSNIECAFKVGVEVTQYDKNGNELISVSKGFDH